MKVVTAPAGIAFCVPRIVRTPNVAAPLFTVSVNVPVFVVALPACGRIGSKLYPLLIVNTTWLPVVSVADVRFVPAVKAAVDAGGADVNAGFGCVAPLVHDGQSVPSGRLNGAGEPTAARKAVAGLPMVVTPVGRKDETPTFRLPLSGTGRFHVMSQLGDSVGIAQAEASIASAKIPTSGRRIRGPSLKWRGRRNEVRGGGGSAHFTGNARLVSMSRVTGADVT